MKKLKILKFKCKFKYGTSYLGQYFKCFDQNVDYFFHKKTKKLFLGKINI